MKWLVLLTAAALFAQERPAFEVASIKANTIGGPASSVRPNKGGIELENQSLRQLVQMAYRLHDFSYSGPAWLDSVRFDIVAKMSAGVTFNQLPEMLQALLAERFKLAIHRETKEMPGLALTVDKKGLCIQSVEPGPGGSGWGANTVGGTKITMAQFAELLSSSLNRPVQDLTALTAVYDIKIRWTPDMPASSDPSDMPGSVFAAVQELGLRLQVQKVPVEMLVVDRAERVPIEN